MSQKMIVHKYNRLIALCLFVFFVFWNQFLVHILIKKMVTTVIFGKGLMYVYVFMYAYTLYL